MTMQLFTSYQGLTQLGCRGRARRALGGARAVRGLREFRPECLGPCHRGAPGLPLSLMPRHFKEDAADELASLATGCRGCVLLHVCCVHVCPSCVNAPVCPHLRRACGAHYTARNVSVVFRVLIFHGGRGEVIDWLHWNVRAVCNNGESSILQS